MSEGRYIAEIPLDTPDAYWDNWWEFKEERVDAVRPVRIIRTKRTGRDAEYDMHVLIDRMASGLRFCIDVYEEGTRP